ncbi:MAG TPA: GGDEF domain-containing protein, partial [Phycisphaerales bacterium]|nr:GGDEF domain-containing protein [Phycisphaerales bacterium]
TAWAALDRHESQLREFAFMDELTGAYNRRFFNRFMASSLEAARNTRQFVTLLYFDIDDFKLYNDRFGHGAGDEILVSVVALLKSVIRPTDKVCRLGGDEFAVIFYDPSPASARPGEESDPSPLRDSRVGGAPQSLQQIAERFQRQICSHRFPKLGEMAPGTLTVSGGMATYPWDGRTPEELLARADELLMGSKAKGKNLITLGPGSIEVCRGAGEPPSDLRG